MDVVRGGIRKVTGARAAKVAPEEAPKLERGNWAGRLEFILTCVGYSVGLGNVWRFPYLVLKNGGGAFLIPYWIMQMFVGMPLFFLELSFGQFASLGPVTIWKVSPLFKGIGYSMVIVLALVGIYYNLIIGYCFFYFFASMTDRLPWAHCDNEWNSPNCVVGNQTLPEGVQSVSSSEDFFNRYVLDQSSGLNDMGAPRWQLVLCLLLAWVVVFVVLSKGIKSLGKVVYFTATFPYILLLAMLIRGATLEGASQGVHYYLNPEWHRLTDATVWSDATTQVFYSLSASSGGLIMMSSFNKFSNNCLRDAILVPLIDCITSFFCGFVIFTVLGFMADSKGVDVRDVAVGGPGLAFVAYPEAIANMPFPVVWAVLFFFMMLIIGFSSQFSIIETLVSSISDEYPTLLRKNWQMSLLFRGGLCLVLFLCALPMTTRGGVYLFSLVDTFVSGFPLLVVGSFECIALCYVYGYTNFAEDIKMMLGKKPFIYWRICWCFITPGLLLAMIIFKATEYEPASYGEYIYPGWAQSMGWLICVFPILAIPSYFMFRLWRIGGRELFGRRQFLQIIKESSHSLPDWGPALFENRQKDPRYANTVSSKSASSLKSKMEINTAPPGNGLTPPSVNGISAVSASQDTLITKSSENSVGNGTVVGREGTQA